MGKSLEPPPCRYDEEPDQWKSVGIGINVGPILMLTP